MSHTSTPPAPTLKRGRRWRHASPALAVVPFFAYVAIFLVTPTVLVVIGAFQQNGVGFSLANIKALASEDVLKAFVASVVLSAVTALIGGIVGGLLAYVLVTGSPRSIARRLVTAVCSLLAQFGGVMLAFAFMATVGRTGIVTELLSGLLGITSTGAWLYSMSGLVLVYSYFQIPLMVIVFLPAVDGIRSQWREAAETLGGSTWVYWFRVAGPLLLPAWLGSVLLLFANSFASYATAAALISQSSPIVPLQISAAMTNEVSIGHADTANSLALGMVVVVAIVMSLYALLQRRASKWLA